MVKYTMTRFSQRMLRKKKKKRRYHCLNTDGNLIFVSFFLCIVDMDAHSLLLRYFFVE